MRKLVVVMAVLLTACSVEPETITVQETVEVPVTVEITREVVQEVEVTRLVEMEVTIIVEITNTPGPTQTPFIEVATTTPTPTSLVWLELEGVGNQVTDNYDWGECQKAVFFWTAAGRDNMIVRLLRAGADTSASLVNEIGPGEGQALQPLLGGTYFLDVDGPAEGWTINLECQD